MSILSRRIAAPVAGPETRRSDFAAEDLAQSRAVLFSPTGLIGECANPGCRTGWMHLFRRRSVPAFEGGWTCSRQCTEAVIVAAIRRELEGRGAAREAGPHRIPLGLLMLEQGWITGQQLRDAVKAQKAAGMGRVGDWLVTQHATDEATVTRALGLQWSSPVLPAGSSDPAVLAALMPRLFLDAFGVLPLRIAADRILYLGFEQSLDGVLAFAVGRMLNMRVENAIVQSSAFRRFQRAMLAAKFPEVQLVEAISEPAAASLLAHCLERTRPVNARLVRVHDCLWLRMWLSGSSGRLPPTGPVSDVVCSIGAF
jgi:hypothetical protein